MSDLRQSARALTRRWWPLAVAVPLGAVAGAGYGAVTHPSYAANSYVVVVSQNQGEGATAVNFAQAYGRLAGQPQVLAGAAAETGHTVAKLAGMVAGTTSPDAPMIQITGTAGSPAEAVQAADAVAKSLIAFADNSTKETGVRLVALAPAAEPDKPSTPSATLDTAVGAAAGVVVGALVMMTRRRPAAQPDPATAEPAGPPRPRSESELPSEEKAAKEKAGSAEAEETAAAAKKEPVGGGKK